MLEVSLLHRELLVHILVVTYSVHLKRWIKPCLLLLDSIWEVRLWDLYKIVTTGLEGLVLVDPILLAV